MSDAVSPRRIDPHELIALREHYWPLMDETRKAVTNTRKMLAGKGGVTLPGSVQMAGAENWLGDLPHKRTNPQRVKQRILSKGLQVRRPQTAAGYNPQTIASRLEQPLDAIMRDEQAGFPDSDVTELLLLEGLAFSTVSMDPINRWKTGPSLYGPDGKTIEKRFAVDASGRLAGDTGYEGVSLTRATRLMQAEKTDFMARNVPFRQRAYSIRQCAPVWGAGLNLEGLIIETHWTPQALLRQKFLIGERKDGSDAQLYPLGALTEGDQGRSGRAVKVTEGWLIDEDGLPYITYCVDGKYTWREGADGLDPYTIDLSKLGPKKDHALTRLPISWGWGLGWSSADIDERAMGYTVPFEQTWRNMDSLMTSLVMWCQWRGMPGLIEKINIGDPASPNVGLEDDENNKTPDFQPGKITQVYGDVTEIATQGIATGVMQAMSMMAAGVQEESSATGIQSASSGFQGSLNAAFDEDALTSVHKSRKQMYARNASFVMEGAKLLGEAWGQNVRVYQIADVLLAQKKPSDREQILELDPSLIGSSYWVEAVDVKRPGDNPAVDQQNAGFVKEKLMTTRQFLEERGDPSPEATVAEIEYETITQSPEGIAFRIRMLEQFVSDEFIQQLVQAMQAGQANHQGLPTGYGAGVPNAPPDMLASGPQATGGMSGLSAPNPASASLNATVGAGLQTGPTQRVLAAGGALPNAPLPGPGG